MNAKRLALAIFPTAAVLSFGWEMAPMFAYVHATRMSFVALRSCLLAALASIARVKRLV